ncbi:MAG: HNH endonuclease signature motif containing protein [Planctomycetota bacterium]|nr:HNH endonuclease signature motif containing protein [Planctomycetota bacterium]
MSEYVPAELRRQVRERSGYRCEYCLIHEDDAFLPHEPDHIIAVKHRGETIEGNLAWTCFVCNRGKGSDIASVDDATGDIVRLYHPRTDTWDDHMELSIDGSVAARTAIGRVTVSLLKLNRPELLAIRKLLAISARKPR